MQENMLSPERPQVPDKIESVLQGISQHVTVFLFGLLPLLFVPIAYLPIDYVKTVIVIVSICIGLIFWSLSVLRSGKISIGAPVVLWALWIAALSSVISALLSGDMRDALIGDDFGVHTALFVVLLASVATVISQTGHSKTTIMRLYILCALSAIVMGVFHIARLVFGVGAFSFGVFTTPTESLVGTWNDLALFFGLTILLSLVALEQLPLTRSGRIFFSTVVGISLIMLAVVNFFAVWIVLGLVSLSLLMYGLTKDRFAEKTLTLEGKNTASSLTSILVSMAVFAVSVIFIIGGGTVGGYLSSRTGISYLEVRPSFEATVDVARQVYRKDAFVGIGPNKFVDAWRLYKDKSINETIFWATDFTGGSGYFTTAFVNTGILGLISWIVFFATFLWAGFRMLFKTVHADRFWYFIGSSSFAGALYIWVMAVFYVPGAVMLLLGALFTGVACTAYVALVPTRTIVLSMHANRKAGLLLVAFTMITIIGTTSGLYYVGQHVSSVYTFSNAVYTLQQGGDVKVAEEQIARAYASSRNELYAMQIASYQLAKINALATVQKLNTVQEQELQASIRNGINAGQIVVSADPTDSQGWSLLGSIYSVLASAGVEGAKDRALEAFGKAKEFDPKNPLHSLFQAQLYSRVQDMAQARAKTLEAISLKQNYTDALSFLTQLDIFEGKTEDAIATTRSITSLEPNNPARHYQLGVLYSSTNKIDDAIASFKEAVRLDTNYANARYFLAIALAQKGDAKGALEQLQVVLSLNPGNQTVMTLIEQLKSGNLPNVKQAGAANGVPEAQTVQSNGNTVTTTEAPNTPLVTPVNTVAKKGSATSSSKR